MTYIFENGSSTETLKIRFNIKLTLLNFKHKCWISRTTLQIRSLFKEKSALLIVLK